MKKLIVACFMLAGFAATVSAQPYEYYRPYTDFDVMHSDLGLKKGDSRIEIIGGLADPQGSITIGDSGFYAGMNFFRQITKPLSIGAELGYAGFSSGETFWNPDAYAYGHFKSGIGMGQVMGRITLFPTKSTRPYIGAGVGASRIWSRFKNLATDDRTTFASTDLIWSLHAGFEFDIDEDYIFGFEARYYHIDLKEKYEDAFGKNHLPFITAMLKFGWKF